MNLANCRLLTSVYHFSQFMVENLELCAIPMDNSYRKPLDRDRDGPGLPVFINEGSRPTVDKLLSICYT